MAEAACAAPSRLGGRGRPADRIQLRPSITTVALFLGDIKRDLGVSHLKTGPRQPRSAQAFVFCGLYALTARLAT